MLCGGLTVFSPLKRHGAAPGKKVGIIGLGGLGVSREISGYVWEIGDILTTNNCLAFRSSLCSSLCVSRTNIMFYWCKLLTRNFMITDFKCDVTVFSHSDNKKEDALKMGAKQFVNTSHENWVKEAGEDYDIIVSTRGGYLQLIAALRLDFLADDSFHL